MNITLFNQLLEILRILSLGFEEQSNFLKDLGLEGEVSELALMFEDSYLLVPQFVRDEKISEKDKLCLDEMNDLLSKMSEKKENQLWTSEGLKTSFEWAEIRRMAARCHSDISQSRS